MASILVEERFADRNISPSSPFSEIDRIPEYNSSIVSTAQFFIFSPLEVSFPDSDRDELEISENCYINVA